MSGVLVLLHRPEGYEDVCDELVMEDARIHPAFKPELAALSAAPAVGGEAVAWAQFEEGKLVALAFARQEESECTTPLYAAPAPVAAMGGGGDAVAHVLTVDGHGSATVGLYDDSLKAGDQLYAAPTNPPAAQQVDDALTDAQCDAIYSALDQYGRDVDSYEFGLPMFADDGGEARRACIRAALANPPQDDTNA